MATHLDAQFPLRSFSQLSDSLPTSLSQDDRPRTVAPTSTQFSPFNYSDPLLCITPEKPSRNRKLDSSKGSQKVRFDSTVEIKHLSPTETSTDLSNQSSASDKEGSRDFSSVNSSWKESTFSSLADTSNQDSGLSQSLSDSSQTTSDSTSTYSTVESEDVDFINVIASDLEDREMDLIYGKKKTARTKSSYVVRASIWGEDGCGDNVLARPELNSTILMRKELQGVKDSSLDVCEAVKHKLKVEDKTRIKVAEKASQRLNASSTPQFQQLVSVEVREEELLQKAAKEKAAKVPPSVKAKAKPEDSLSAPDILEFFTADLQREIPCFSVEGIPTGGAVPRTADLHHTFDSYRHIRAWEGW